ncbi:MAG: sugar phosphate isomerase/epimerase, partial [Pedosphaera parvula]|nr:sugar phosphate isomerase/epimerase [Pedosphaera parvula]
MKSAVTISLVPEARGGPFVFWDGLEAGFAQAAKLGFDAVEIFPPSAEDLNARELKRLCAAHSLRIAAIGTGAGWVRHKLRLTDPDATVRRRAQQFIAAIIDFAGGFNAPAIIGSMQGRWGDGVAREQALAWLAEALEQLGPRAHAHGVPLLYEPLNRYETNLFTRVADAVEFLKPLRTRNLKLLCDLFHMNIEEASMPDALRAGGSYVGHIHFADSNRQAVGWGHTDMPPIIAALRDIGYTGYLSAEVFALPDS